MESEEISDSAKKVAEAKQKEIQAYEANFIEFSEAYRAFNEKKDLKNKNKSKREALRTLMKSEKVLKLIPNLDCPAEDHYLKTQSGNMNIVFDKNVSFSAHSYAYNARNIGERHLLGLVGWESFNAGKQGAPFVIDIGGNASRHAKQGRENIHSCMLIASALDSARVVTRNLNIDNHTLNGSIELNAYKQNIGNRYYCEKGAENCPIKAARAICVHAAYDIGAEMLANIMVKKNIVHLAGTLLYDPKFFFNYDGTINKSYNDKNYGHRMIWKRVGEYIEFRFQDGQLGYVHNFKTFMSFFVSPVVYSSKGECFMIEICPFLEGEIIFQMRRATFRNGLENVVSSLPVSTAEKGDMMLITGIDSRYCNERQMYIAYKRNLLFPRVVHDAILGFSMRVGNANFTVAETFSVAMAYGRRVIISGSEVISKVEINIDDLHFAVNCIFLNAYITKYDRGYILKKYMKEIEAEREFRKENKPGLFMRVLNEIYAFVRPKSMTVDVDPHLNFCETLDEQFILTRFLAPGSPFKSFFTSNFGVRVFKERMYLKISPIGCIELRATVKSNHYMSDTLEIESESMLSVILRESEVFEKQSWLCCGLNSNDFVELEKFLKTRCGDNWLKIILGNLSELTIMSSIYHKLYKQRVIFSERNTLDEDSLDLIARQFGLRFIIHDEDNHKAIGLLGKSVHLAKLKGKYYANADAKCDERHDYTGLKLSNTCYDYMNSIKSDVNISIQTTVQGVNVMSKTINHDNESTIAQSVKKRFDLLKLKFSRLCRENDTTNLFERYCNRLHTVMEITAETAHVIRDQFLHGSNYCAVCLKKYYCTYKCALCLNIVCDFCISEVTRNIILGVNKRINACKICADIPQIIESTCVKNPAKDKLPFAIFEKEAFNEKNFNSDKVHFIFGDFIPLEKTTKKKYPTETSFGDIKLRDTWLRTTMTYLEIFSNTVKYKDAAKRADFYGLFDLKTMNTKCYFKIHSLMQYFDAKGEFLDICSAPGQFSKVFVLEKKLKGYYINDDLRNKMTFTDPSLQRYLPSVDILTPDLRTMLSGVNIKVDFCIADGAVDDAGRESMQEMLNLPLLISEILIALYALKNGGSFVLKTFNISTFTTIRILGYMKILFSEMLIIKPVTSKPTSMERYIVFKGYSRINDIIDNFWSIRTSMLTGYYTEQRCENVGFVSSIIAVNNSLMARVLAAFMRLQECYDTKTTFINDRELDKYLRILNMPGLELKGEKLSVDMMVEVRVGESGFKTRKVLVTNTYIKIFEENAISVKQAIDLSRESFIYDGTYIMTTKHPITICFNIKPEMFKTKTGIEVLTMLVEEHNNDLLSKYFENTEVGSDNLAYIDDEIVTVSENIEVINNADTTVAIFEKKYQMDQDDMLRQVLEEDLKEILLNQYVLSYTNPIIDITESLNMFKLDDFQMPKTVALKQITDSPNILKDQFEKVSTKNFSPDWAVMQKVYNYRKPNFEATTLNYGIHMNSEIDVNMIMCELKFQFDLTVRSPHNPYDFGACAYVAMDAILTGDFDSMSFSERYVQFMARTPLVRHGFLTKSWGCVEMFELMAVYFGLNIVVVHGFKKSGILSYGVFMYINDINNSDIHVVVNESGNHYSLLVNKDHDNVSTVGVGKKSNTDFITFILSQKISDYVSIDEWYCYCTCKAHKSERCERSKLYVAKGGDLSILEFLGERFFFCPSCSYPVVVEDGCDWVLCPCGLQLCGATRGPRWGLRGCGCTREKPCTDNCLGCHYTADVNEGFLDEEYLNLRKNLYDGLEALIDFRAATVRAKCKITYTFCDHDGLLQYEFGSKQENDCVKVAFANAVSGNQSENYDTIVSKVGTVKGGFTVEGIRSLAIVMNYNVLLHSDTGCRYLDVGSKTTIAILVSDDLEHCCNVYSVRNKTYYAGYDKPTSSLLMKKRNDSRVVYKPKLVEVIYNDILDVKALHKSSPFLKINDSANKELIKHAVAIFHCHKIQYVYMWNYDESTLDDFVDYMLVSAQVEDEGAIEIFSNLYYELVGEKRVTSVKEPIVLLRGIYTTVEPDLKDMIKDLTCENFHEMIPLEEKTQQNSLRIVVGEWYDCASLGYCQYYKGSLRFSDYERLEFVMKHDLMSLRGIILSTEDYKISDIFVTLKFGTTVYYKPRIADVKNTTYGSSLKPVDFMDDDSRNGYLMNAFLELRSTWEIRINEAKRICDRTLKHYAKYGKLSKDDYSSNIYHAIPDRFVFGIKGFDEVVAFKNYTHYYLNNKFVKIDQNTREKLSQETSPVLFNDFMSVFVDYMLYHKFSVIKLQPSVRIELTNGVPGCGKTHHIVMNATSNQLILASTKVGAADIKRKLKDLRGANEDQLFNVMTIDKYLLHGGNNHEEVVVDEAMMQHFGKMALIIAKSGCKLLKVYGDTNQIGYVNTTNKTLMFSDFNHLDITNSLSVSYRCPTDVCRILSLYYSNGMTSYGKKGVFETASVKVVRYTSLVLPIEKDVWYLTFTQKEKEDLINKRGLKNVNTVHEYQGKQHDNIRVVRINPIESEYIFMRKEYALVAFSRHSKSLIYFVPQKINDALTALITGQSPRKQKKTAYKGIDTFYADDVLRPEVHSCMSLPVSTDEIPRLKYVNLHGVNTKLKYGVYYNMRKNIVKQSVERKKQGNWQTLQHCYDEILPGNSESVLDHDVSLLNNADVNIYLHNTVVLKDNLLNVVPVGKRRGKVFRCVTENNGATPVLRTTADVKQQRTAVVDLYALAKRNMMSTTQRRQTDDKFFATAVVLKAMDTYFKSDDHSMGELKNFYNNKLTADVESTRAWQLKTNKLGKKLPDVATHDFDGNYTFMSKTTTKPVIALNASSKFNSPQTINYKDFPVNLYFSPLLKNMWLRMKSVLRDNVIINTDMSTVDFVDTLNEKVPPASLIGSTYKELDMSKFDKSQDAVALEIDCLFMRIFGISDCDIQLWRDMHENTKLVGMSHTSKIRYQRKSGDPFTFLGNTLFTMSTIAYVYNFATDGAISKHSQLLWDIENPREVVINDLSERVSDTYCYSRNEISKMAPRMELMLAGGDDSVFFMRGYQADEDKTQLLTTLFNLESKFFDYASMYFCSKYLLIINNCWAFVPDPIKILSKLGRHDITTLSHLEEYRVSTLDNFNTLTSNLVDDALSAAVSERIGTRVCITPLLDALYNVLSDSRLFAEGFQFDDNVFNVYTKDNLVIVDDDDVEQYRCNVIPLSRFEKDIDALNRYERIYYISKRKCKYPTIQHVDLSKNVKLKFVNARHHGKRKTKPLNRHVT